MHVYIASSLDNIIRVREIRDILILRGINITYDWTSHGYSDDIEELKTIARCEYDGVVSATCVLLVLPARIGSHFEFGVAYAKGIPIVILNESNDEREVSFYYLPSIYKYSDAQSAINKVIEVVKHDVV